MKRTKIDFGIDLGTTNSAIAKMQNGTPTIIRSDKSKDIISSCVGFNKKKTILVGDAAFNKYRSDKLLGVTRNIRSNTFIEFKRTMGTDKVYKSSFMESEYNSEQLSAEVLKKLRSFETDENFHSAVITVPAKFDIRQKDATQRAAKLAGFQYCELLQEPIAASMAYGLDNKSKNGYWIVFDFGGGTFDVALVRVEEGIMKIKDTDGDNYLGGKNLDYAIVDEILIPHLSERFNMESYLGNEASKSALRDALKYFAEEAKNELSFKEFHELFYEDTMLEWEDDDGEDIDIDLTITREDLKKVIGPIFQRAIDINKELLQRNNLTGDKLDALILVGGPTHSSVLREMLEEQIKKPDTSADPMIAIATGAALYASTVDNPVEGEISKDKIQIDIGYNPTTVEKQEWITLKLLPEKTDGEIPDKVFAEIEREDKMWTSGKIEINDKGEIIEVLLNEGKSNGFKVSLYDEYGNGLSCEPDSFTIIQGISDGGSAAVLNHGIGIAIDAGKPYPVFEPVKGLEKNVPLPATGTINGLKTKTDIRPGKSKDMITIGLYQGEYDAAGSRAINNKPIYEDIVITGDDLPSLVPANSDVDLTIITDKSAGRIEKLKAFFHYLDYTHEVPIPQNPLKVISKEKLDEELSNGEKTIKRLKSNNLIDQEQVSEIEKELSYLRKRFDQGGMEEDQRAEILENLQKALRKADVLESDDRIEWTSLEKELNEEFANLEHANEQVGNEKSSQRVAEFRSQLNEVIRNQDIATGKELLEQIKQYYVGLTFIYQLIGFVREHKENFNSVQWNDPNKARQLIHQAEQIIMNNPTVESLHPKVVEIINCMEDAPTDEVGKDILRKS
jgi:molecular chaperone DnaK